MTLRYEYPAGVLPEEEPTVEIFERDVLPFVMKNGSEIGTKAMQGDKVCEEIIRRHDMFVGGLPSMRATNLRLLISALKLWEAARAH